jgi:signal transduction histidine kinase
VKRTILYVDDEADNRIVFQANLEDRFHVLTAADADQALAILQEISVPVVVADHRMPGTTGVKLFSVLRTRYPHTKRVLMTAYTEPSAVIDAINQGQVYYFLRKPWDRETIEPVLVRAIEAYDLTVALEEQSLVLSRQNKELRDTQNRLEQANRSKSEFLANMSHEIRTPMTAILGFANLLNDSLTSPADIEAVDTIRRNGEYLIEIINDILDLSKIEAGRLQLERGPCSPREIAAEVINLLRPRCQAKGLSLDYAVDEAVPPIIQSDALRLRQVLLNLVGNAIKFTESGAVRVDARLVEDRDAGELVRFDVNDTGIGIRADCLGGLFQPFSQGDTTVTRRFGGTGLGLALSRRLAQLLGGEIAVASVPGQGSTFTLTVAVLAPQSEAAPAINPESPRPQLQTGGKLPKLSARILLAEDGPDNQRLMTFMLKSAGAELVVVENGREAVDQVAAALAAGRPYDLVLMDMQMPVLDGYRATSELRAGGFTAPVIAVTAHAMSGDRQKCLNAGCDDVVTKPFSRSGLLEAVERCLTVAWSSSRRAAGLKRQAAHA